jgi:hypothetical protein
MSREQCSVFYSDDMDLKAIVYYDLIKKQFEVDYAKGGLIVATEAYEGRSEQYHEDAAENYVMGIKKI